VLTSRVNDQRLEMTGGSRLEATRDKALRNFHDEIMRDFCCPWGKGVWHSLPALQKAFPAAEASRTYRRVKRHWIHQSLLVGRSVYEPATKSVGRHNRSDNTDPLNDRCPTQMGCHLIGSTD